MAKMKRILSLPYHLGRYVLWAIPLAVCSGMLRGMLAAWRFILATLLSIPYVIKYEIITFWNAASYLWRLLTSIPRRIIRSPVKSYRAVLRVRDWLLARVEYLQSESQKWKTLFNIAKAPYSLLRSFGLSPQLAATFLFAGTTLTTGAVVNATVFTEKSFSRGDPGVYSAPLDTPVFSPEDFNTLRLDLGATPIGIVTISDITVGTAYATSALPSGEANVVVVGGLTSTALFTATYLEVGYMTVDRWRCTTLTLTNIEAHELIVKQNASDGQSIAAVAGTPRARAIGGGNRATDMITSGGYYDQVKITSATSGVNGQIDKLTLSNLYTKGGGCVLDRIKAGTLEIILNETGAGDGFSTKDFQIATSVIYKSFTNEDNVEVSISPPS